MLIDNITAVILTKTKPFTVRRSYTIMFMTAIHVLLTHIRKQAELRRPCG